MPDSRSKLHILQIIKGLDIGGLNGGAERFSIDLARAIDRNLFNVSICVFFQMHTPTALAWEKRLEECGMDFFYATQWAGNNNFRSYLRGVSTLRERARQTTFDLAHSHFQLGTLAALSLKASGLTRRALRTAHIDKEWEPNAYGWAREQALSNWLLPILLDAEVGVSQAIVDRLNKHPGARLFSRKAFLIHNAIPLESTPQALGSFKARKKDQAYVVGVIGRLAEQKGHRFLLEAAPLVHEEIPEVSFWIIGDGELRSDLEAQAARLDLTGYVKFLGHQNEVPTLLKQMDLFVLPSLWEGLPTVIMESFAQGVPVLATDIPGTSELVQHGQTGWLVPPHNPAALARAIVTILNDPAGRERARQAGFQAVQQFSIESIGGQYIRLYQSLLGE